MAVKSSSTAAKVLAVLDAVARHQPVGVSELARQLDENKSMIQRMLITLSEEGWIRPEPNGTTKWRATRRLRLLADFACTDDDLRNMARSTLEALRNMSGETVSLVVNDADRFIVVDVVESEELLRAVPRVGDEVPGPISASSLAFLPYMTKSVQRVILGCEPTLDHESEYARIREEGFAVAERPSSGTITIAAPIRDSAGEPVAAIALSAPIARLPQHRWNAVGRDVRQAAQGLSGQ